MCRLWLYVGALSIPLAKRVNFVISIDQTFESLLFLKRYESEDLNNHLIIKANLRQYRLTNDIDIKIDVALVNGV